MNLLDDAGWLERTWPPERPGYRWRRKRVAGENLGASLYELPPGEKAFPYHYELGNDELLVVVSGRPTLRDPDGERRLEPGDCVLFPSGPEGAHQVVNRSSEPARVLLVSNFALPRAAVQADSGKIMIRWSREPDDARWFHLDDAAEYWEASPMPSGARDIKNVSTGRFRRTPGQSPAAPKAAPQAAPRHAPRWLNHPPRSSSRKTTVLWPPSSTTSK